MLNPRMKFKMRWKRIEVVDDLSDDLCCKRALYRVVTYKCNHTMM